MTLKVLVAGCGSIGRRHIRNLRLLRPQADLIAFRRPGQPDLELVELGVRVHTELVAALDENPDAVLVTNPTSLHVPTALEAARRGCHLFIEKPLSDSLHQVEDLTRVVDDRGLIALMGLNMRFHPAIRRIKELIRQDTIGPVLSFRVEVGQYLPEWRPGQDYRQSYSARRALGGGVILDLIHELDYATWLMGSVTQVACFAGHVSTLEIETEDVAEILLTTEAGAIGSVHVDYVSRPATRNCQIIGESGTILWDYFSNETRVSIGNDGGPQTFRDQGFERNDMYLAEMEHFLSCMERREQPETGLDEGVRSLKLALAARESAATSRIIRL